MIPQPTVAVVRSLSCLALVTPAPVFIAPQRSMGMLAASWSARKVCATNRAEASRLPAFRRPRDLAAPLAWRVGASAPVGGSVLAVCIASAARCHQVLGSVVSRVTVQVVGAGGQPGELVTAPVTRLFDAVHLRVQDQPADENFAVFGRKRMRGQVARRAFRLHAVNDSQPQRVNDPGERARALGVPKPPPVMDGQLDLFGGDAA